MARVPDGRTGLLPKRGVKVRHDRLCFSVVRERSTPHRLNPGQVDLAVGDAVLLCPATTAALVIWLRT